MAEHQLGDPGEIPDFLDGRAAKLAADSAAAKAAKPAFKPAVPRPAAPAAPKPPAATSPAAAKPAFKPAVPAKPKLPEIVDNAPPGVAVEEAPVVVDAEPEPVVAKTAKSKAKPVKAKAPEPDAFSEEASASLGNRLQAPVEAASSDPYTTFSAAEPINPPKGTLWVTTHADGSPAKKWNGKIWTVAKAPPVVDTTASEPEDHANDSKPAKPKKGAKASAAKPAKAVTSAKKKPAAGERSSRAGSISSFLLGTVKPLLKSWQVKETLVKALTKASKGPQVACDNVVRGWLSNETRAGRIEKKDGAGRAKLYRSTGKK